MRIPIASDGWRFIVGFAVVGAFLVLVGQWWSVALGVVSLLLVLFCAWFFRDLNRITPQDENAVYSPGDGKVVEVSVVAEGAHIGHPIVRIFLSVFDVHVQRVPVTGKVTAVDYRKGKFLDARHARAHMENEQNLVTIASKRGPVVVNQIAGLIARRILCWVGVGASVTQGQRYGLIRFGSQVDVIFPKDSVVWSVKTGDRVVGGETVIARWK